MNSSRRLKSPPCVYLHTFNYELLPRKVKYTYTTLYTVLYVHVCVHQHLHLHVYILLLLYYIVE